MKKIIGCILLPFFPFIFLNDYIILGILFLDYNSMSVCFKRTWDSWKSAYWIIEKELK